MKISLWLVASILLCAATSAAAPAYGDGFTVNGS